MKNRAKLCVRVQSVARGRCSVPEPCARHPCEKRMRRLRHGSRGLAIGLAFMFMLVNPARESIAAWQPASAVPADKPKPVSTEDFLRVSEDEEGSRVRLEVASRSFESDKGPLVWLVGAVHVGDKAYYEQLQKLLDSNEVVLFERVKPPADSAPEVERQGDHAEPDQMAARVEATKARIRI